MSREQAEHLIGILGALSYDEQVDAAERALREATPALVDAFARKIAALSIDAAEQKGRADRAEAEIERLRVEYEPGYPPAAAEVSSDTPPGAGCERCILWPILANQRDQLQRELAAANARASKEIRGWADKYASLTDTTARAEAAHAATTAKLGRALERIAELEKSK